MSDKSIDPSMYRLLDANLNRIREALRVLEDHARFMGDDAEITGRLKHLRHALKAIRETLPSDALLAARDVPADVGRTIKTMGEQTRTDVGSVVRAAFGRLTEAARSLAEYAKVVSPAAAEAAEAVRYESYALEPVMVLRGARLNRLRQARLYVLVTEALSSGDWQATVEQFLEVGVPAVQLREKDLPDNELLERARWLRSVTAAHGALLIINDRPDIARLCEADGVHVGQDDLSVAEARIVVGASRLVGKSTHSPEQFAAALEEQPDYVAIGPMFASDTKPQAHIAGVETLRTVRATTQRPIVAIGGVTAVNAATVREAGADVLCVCGAVIGQADPRQAAGRLLGKLE